MSVARKMSVNLFIRHQRVSPQNADTHCLHIWLALKGSVSLGVLCCIIGECNDIDTHENLFSSDHRPVCGKANLARSRDLSSRVSVSTWKSHTAGQVPFILEGGRKTIPLVRLLWHLSHSGVIFSD